MTYAEPFEGDVEPVRWVNHEPYVDLWRGLDPEADLSAYFQRALLRARLEGRGEVLLPGFGQEDWSGWTDVPVDARDERKKQVILSDAEDEHEGRHWFYQHPFCRSCRPGILAEGALARWLILNPGRTPRDTWDGSSFPEVAKAQGEAGEGREAYLTLDELEALPEVEMLVGEIVPQGSVGYITGRDGTYKTFLALDLALHIITCRAEWNGREISWNGWGRVLFIAGEGARSFPKRRQAWSAHHGHELTASEKQALVVRNGAVDLYGGQAAFRVLLEVVGERQDDLIVIDTYNRSAGAADQNSASDASVITARIAEVRAAAGPDCTVIVIAHTDKGDKDARGSSAIEDDADFVLHCKIAERGRLAVTVAKMKDGPSGQTIDLKVNVVRPPCAHGDDCADPACTSVVLTSAGEGDKPTDDKKSEWVILRWIADAEALAVSQAEIVKGTGLDKSAVSRWVKKLHERGQLQNVGTDSRPRYRVPR